MITLIVILKHNYNLICGEKCDKNRGHNKGKKWKQKTKRKNIVMCPHCNKTGDASGLKRWHFDNCKDKII